MQALDLNDVSWLFPVPLAAADLDNAISIDAIKTPAGAAVWSDDQFSDLLKTVDGDVGVGSK